MTGTSYENGRSNGRGRGREPEHPENGSGAELEVTGKVPPHDLDAEACVLSACMLRGDYEAVDVAAALCAPEEFYSEAHRQIFNAVVELRDANQPIDIMTVGGWLKDRERLAQVGGTKYLAEILDHAPIITDKHLRAYATRVRNKYRLRQLAYQLRLATARVYGPMPDEETEKFLSDLEHSVSNICTRQRQGELHQIGPVARAFLRKCREHEAKGGGIVGIATGFKRLDKMTGGLHDGDLTLVAARPGLGKTSFVMNVCDNITERDYAGLVFSLEMPREQLAGRLLCARGRVDVSKPRTGTLTAGDWTKLEMAASELFPRWIHVDDMPGQSWAQIRAKARSYKALCNRNGKKLGCVIVDFLQLIRTRDRGRGMSRSEAVGEVAREAKNTAKELECPVVLLSQLNREVEKRDQKRPLMSDLRDSGEIEEAADNIILIYRDDYYDDETDEPNIAELIVGKQRNGTTGTTKVRFDKQWTRFDDISDFDDPPDDDGIPYERSRAEPSTPPPVPPPPSMPGTKRETPAPEATGESMQGAFDDLLGGR